MSIRISDSKRKLKAQSSFDSDYWVRRTDIAEKEVEHARLQKRISIRDFLKTDGGTEQEWVKTPEARELFEQEKTYVSEHRIYSRQAEKLNILPGQKPKNIRRAFTQPSTKRPSGLGVSTEIQSNFRKALIKVSNAARPTGEAVCCPVLSEWVSEGYSTAAHMFSYKHGQAMMDAIFGREKGAEPELFSPRNGIIIDTLAEKKFDKGLFLSYWTSCPKRRRKPGMLQTPKGTKFGLLTPKRLV